MRLLGVAGGGPAAKAGLTRGDLVVELAGRKIENILDLTYAVETLKIGESVKIVVERQGERITFDITPGARK